jgi:hypothetical protein
MLLAPSTIGWSGGSFDWCGTNCDLVMTHAGSWQFVEIQMPRTSLIASPGGEAWSRACQQRCHQSLTAYYVLLINKLFFKKNMSISWIVCDLAQLAMVLQCTSICEHVIGHSAQLALHVQWTWMLRSSVIKLGDGDTINIEVSLDQSKWSCTTPMTLPQVQTRPYSGHVGPAWCPSSQTIVELAFLGLLNTTYKS